MAPVRVADRTRNSPRRAPRSAGLPSGGKVTGSGP
jgi:hypothetical protein